MEKPYKTGTKPSGTVKNASKGRVFSIEGRSIPKDTSKTTSGLNPVAHNPYK